MPLRCVFFNGEEKVFEEDDALEGCLMIIPSIESGQINYVGAAFWLSRDVWTTVFTHLYLFDEDWDYFEKIYDDSNKFPLALYNGGIIGPLKIWEVSYPDDLNIPEEYYGTIPPDGVDEVKR